MTETTLSTDRRTAKRVRGAERQNRLREKRASCGIVPLTLWVPKHTIAEFKQIAEKACSNDNHDVVVVLRDRVSGKFL